MPAHSGTCLFFSRSALISPHLLQQTNGPGERGRRRYTSGRAITQLVSHRLRETGSQLFQERVLSRFSLTVRPYGLEPARLLCPWDSPGKDTGVCCHALLQWNLPNSGIEPTSFIAPALAGGFFIISITWEASGSSTSPIFTILLTTYSFSFLFVVSCLHKSVSVRPLRRQNMLYSLADITVSSSYRLEIKA